MQGFPAAAGQRLVTAWGILKELDRGPADADDVAVIERIIGGAAPQLDIPVLTRIASLPKTKLKIVGKLAPMRDPGQAGGTSLVAKYGAEQKQDTGFVAGPEFAEFVNRVPTDKRDQVAFTIEVVVMVPKHENQAQGGKYPTTDHFLETLTHELAVHGEKYVDIIGAYRKGEAWQTTYEHSEHREFMFVGEPRYMLLLAQLKKAALRGESIGGVPAKALLKGIFAQLRESEKVYTREGIKPFPDRGSQEMLDWVGELMVGDLIPQ